MSDPMQTAVERFHLAAGATVARVPDFRDVTLRVGLIQEEWAEFVDATLSGDFPGACKELADLTYVVFGTAVAWGIDLREIFDAVHDSNMSKIEGMEKRVDGKVLKGPNYRPPDIRRILIEEGWQG